MRYLMLRRSSAANEAGVPLSDAAMAALGAYVEAMAGAGILCACERLLPSSHGVRLVLGAKDGMEAELAELAQMTDGPFAETKELIAGFAVIDVPDRATALAWLQRWPAEDEGAEVELRQAGCPGGCAEVLPADGAGQQGKRFIVLLRSSRALEDEAPVGQDKLDALDAYNAPEAAKGVLLAADGLRTSALGARFTPGARFALVDGPFTEIKEMIAGYWLIRVASLDEAIAWARRTPYPCPGTVELEIREVEEVAGTVDDAAAGELEFTPELRAAEQRMRAGQLESGMHARLSARPPAWR